MKIPKSFKLFGRTVSVIIVPGLVAREDARGVSSYRLQQIQLEPLGEVNLIENQEQTFCHELIHWLLFALGEGELGNNEKFVDLMGSALHQALTTMEYD